MTSVLDVPPGADFALDASDTMLSDVTVTSDAGWRMALPEGPAHHDPDRTGKTRRYDVAFAARDLAPPGPMRTPARPRRRSARTPSKRSTTPPRWSFDRPWDLRAIEDRRPQITALDLREMNAVMGRPDPARGGRCITVDERRYTGWGAIAIRAENWREMVAMTVRAGLIPEQVQGTVEGLSGRRRGPCPATRRSSTPTSAFSNGRDVPRPAAHRSRAAPAPALTAVGAGPVGRHVEMEVVLVEPVRIGAEHRAERPAGVAMRLAAGCARPGLSSSRAEPTTRFHSPARCPRCRWRSRVHVR
jgi:hypothetical protein